MNRAWDLDAIWRHRVDTMLETAPVLWLASTRADRRPHLAPCWFVWDGETITVLSRPAAQKVRNLTADPRVMVAIGSAHPEFDVDLFEGIAEVGAPLSDRARRRFIEKYASGLAHNGFDPEGFVAHFTTVIHIRPHRLLDWGLREMERRMEEAPAAVSGTSMGAVAWTGLS